jgi:hypothetical protein
MQTNDRWNQYQCLMIKYLLSSLTVTFACAAVRSQAALDVDMSAQLEKSWGVKPPAQIRVKWNQAMHITGYINENILKEIIKMSEERRNLEKQRQSQTGSESIDTPLDLKPKEQKFINTFSFEFKESKWKFEKSGYIYIPSKSVKPIVHNYSVAYNGNSVVEHTTDGINNWQTATIDNMSANAVFDADIGRIIYCRLLGPNHPKIPNFSTERMEFFTHPNVNGKKAIKGVERDLTNKTLTEYVFIPDFSYSIVSAMKYSNGQLMIHYDADIDSTGKQTYVPVKWKLRSFQDNKLVSIRECKLISFEKDLNISDSNLTVNIPAGTEVYDNTDGKGRHLVKKNDGSLRRVLRGEHISELTQKLKDNDDFDTVGHNRFLAYYFAAGAFLILLLYITMKRVRRKYFYSLAGQKL